MYKDLGRAGSRRKADDAAAADNCVNVDWICQWEMAIFDPIQNRHLSTDHQNICHMWLRRRPLKLCQIRCIYVRGGFLGTWVKYNQNYFYLYTSLRNSPTAQIRPVDGFSRTMAQNDAVVHMAPHLRVKHPKNSFGTWISVFKPESRSRKTCILSKLLHRFQPNIQILHSDKDYQMLCAGGPNTCITNPRWRTAAILEKSKNYHISPAVRTISIKFDRTTQFDPLELSGS